MKKIISFLFFVFLIYSFIYYYIFNSFEKSYFQKQEYKLDAISYNLKSKALLLLYQMDNDYKNYKQKVIKKHIFVKNILKNVKNPIQYNLADIFNKINQSEDKRFDVYITDENFIIKNTTFKNDLNFDLSFAKEDFIKHKKQNIIGFAGPIFETSSKNFFCYSDSFIYKNKNNILQISVNLGQYKNYLKPIKKILKENKIVSYKIFTQFKNSFNFDLILNEYKKYKPNLTEINKRIEESKKFFSQIKDLGILKKTIKKDNKTLKEIIIKEDFKTQSFVFYILFDETYFYKQLEIYHFYFLLVYISGIIFIIFSFILIYNLSKEQQKSNNQKYLLDKLDRFVKDAVHEIHTPLSIITLNNDLRKQAFGIDEYYLAINSAIKKLKVVYEDLSFGIKYKNFKYEKKLLNISEVLNDRIKYFESILLANKLKINFKIEPNIFYKISLEELVRLIDNNLSNAIKYSFVNSTIEVDLSKDEEFIVLTFKNSSKNILDKEKIFNRFYREDNIKGGFGIGLSIVSDIAKKYNIKIELIPNKNLNIFKYFFPL